jgi:GWxTD domain-containing protein
MRDSINDALAATLGRTLLHSLWEGAVVALALALILPIVRSSRLRYGFASGAMLVLLGGLAITFARLMPAPIVHISLTGPRYATPLPPGLGAAPPTPLPTRATDELAWLAPFWMAGVVLFYLRGMTSWMAARRLRRSGVCCAANVWQARLTRLKQQLQVTRPVMLLESCLAEVPVVVGYVRPMILMPVGLLAGLPVAQVEAILLHELAHIRRYDYVVNLMQVFVEGLLFYHPAVWWISGVMRAERENCCDDLVVAVTGGALEYAAALTALETRRGPREVLAVTGGNLVSRIQRLLGKPERRFATGFANVMPVFTAAILTVTVVTAVTALQSGASVAHVAISPAAAPGPVVPKARLAAKIVLVAQAKQAASTMQPYAQQPDQVLYDRAISDIAHGNYATARLTLNTLINTYTDSVYLIRAKLAIADSWAREGGAHGLAQAQVEYKDFIQFFPNTPEAQEAQQRLNALPGNALLTPYKKWLNEDVVYIISAEERKAFVQLADDEEREKFVEQFWARRDPTPSTEKNEFKEEIYRRIDYANVHFGDPQGVAGWKTDRGRVYIQYGPPDQIESHAKAGPYERPAVLGGGIVNVPYPFEQWRYRYIDGVGQNIIIEFVDKDGNGQYRMTMDPSEKDALFAPQPFDRH